MNPVKVATILGILALPLAVSIALSMANGQDVLAYSDV
jgi:hypothetical protein